MTFTDAPDYQEVAVTVSAAGDTPDAPDWQRTIVGPDGTPIGGGGFPAGVQTVVLPKGVILSTSGTLLTLNPTYTGTGWMLVTWYCACFLIAAAVGDAIELQVFCFGTENTGARGGQVTAQVAGVQIYRQVGGAFWLKPDPAGFPVELQYVVNGSPTDALAEQYDELGVPTSLSVAYPAT